MKILDKFFKYFNKIGVNKNNNENKIKTKEDEEVNQRWEKFVQYFRVSTITGIMYGMAIGWMWGLKGFFIYGPLVGFIVGLILAVIFTFDKRNKNIDRDQYL